MGRVSSGGVGGALRTNHDKRIWLARLLKGSDLFRREEGEVSSGGEGVSPRVVYIALSEMWRKGLASHNHAHPSIIPCALDEVALWPFCDEFQVSCLLFLWTKTMFSLLTTFLIIVPKCLKTLRSVSPPNIYASHTPMHCKQWK